MKELNRNIKVFYDASSGLWESVWGEHMHHGYYGPEGKARTSDYAAQVDMIEKLLAWGGVDKPRRILDLGCGIGGSSLHLARKYNAEVWGITLSPVQAGRAMARAAEAGMSEQVHFKVADALEPPFEDGFFDLVWTLESGEHMPEKPRFMQTCANLLAPGGRLLMATWCHRTLPPALSPSEDRLLQKLYKAYHLPYIISVEGYRDLAAASGLKALKTDDWTEAVAPFWWAVARSAVSVRGVKGLLTSGTPTLRGAVAINLMIRGYRKGLIRYGLLTGQK